MDYQPFRGFAQGFGSHPRRRFLTFATSTLTLALTSRLPVARATGSDLPPSQENPFTLGVASGDPVPDGVVLWTRLAPRPREVGGGMPPDGAVTVQWQIAADEAFRRVVHQGTARAEAGYGYSIHAEVPGLEPGRTYWYRFRTGPWISPTGRTRTTPAAGTLPGQARLGLASCQQYDGGYYTAHAHLAQEDLDAVFFVGDYIYENAITPQAGGRQYPPGEQVPESFGHECTTLDDYRLRYALYKSDPQLQAAHAAHPWCVTWDDHEVENNYAGAVSQDNDPTGLFLQRRAAAYRAYWENMPLRRAQHPYGADARLYRRLRYGRLAALHILDTRQYRDDQAYGDGWQYPGPGSDNPARSITGHAQERWLTQGLDRTGIWHVIPQQVVFSQRKRTVGRSPVSMDAWDGYPDSRRRILTTAQHTKANLIVLSGDAHAHYAMDIKQDFDDPDSPTLGAEFVTTSISSGGDGTATPLDHAAMLGANPHIKFYNVQRGYTVLTLTPTDARAEHRTVGFVTRPGAPRRTAAAFITEAGRPGLHPV
ncbi:alkaline phosphatase D family protein [Streptomyces triculaminicus]|uniref:alkaline phosphatase D family protein n=1 Tax=Streptomyces triculaminicus TaxID=2816232 RepID=UPI0034080BCE